MDRFARIVAGRWTKLAVLGAWLAVLAALGQQIGALESKEKNEPVSFLPGDAESVAVLEASRQFRLGEGTYAVPVFARASGLTAADRAAVMMAREEINAAPPEGVRPVAEPGYSADGRAALLVVPIVAGGEEEILIDAVESVSETVQETSPPGLTTKVTGPGGYSADASKVFEGINSKLLLATTLLVFVLLVFIYRSPIFWILPLRPCSSPKASCAASPRSSRTPALLSSTARPRASCSSSSSVQARITRCSSRPDTGRSCSHEDRHEAMAIAVRKAGPAIVASAATVVAALLCLSFASVNSTAGLGPIGAMGVAVAARSPC